MTPDANQRDSRRDGSRPGPETTNSVERTGTYEADDGIVFYDTEEPLAWLRSDRTCRLTDRR